MKQVLPQAVQASHGLLRWLIPQMDKLPRLRRFTSYSGSGFATLSPTFKTYSWSGSE